MLEQSRLSVVEKVFCAKPEVSIEYYHSSAIFLMLVYFFKYHITNSKESESQ